jgi:DNA-directed RNA polymerase subunit RPC12/RpoP
MSMNCAKCGEHLETAWAFCPHCAVPCGHDSQPVSRKHEAAPVTGGFSGLLFGLITAPALIISGTLMCLMVGPWMAVGIPFIIAGICAPFVGPLIGISAARGICPWCGARISSIGLLDAFYCYACSKRVVVRNRELLRAE